MAAEAAQSLRSWRGVDYAAYSVDDVGVLTRMSMTVTRDGLAHGTLSRGYGAAAEVVTDPRRMLLRGNREWWLGDEPGSADSLAGTWISDPPQRVTSLVKAMEFAPARLAAAIFPPGRDDWTNVGASSAGGRSAWVLSNGKVQILVSASAPHRLLALGPSPSLPVYQRTTVLPTGTGVAWYHDSHRQDAAWVTTAVSTDAEPPADATSAIGETAPAQAQQTTAYVRRVGRTQTNPPRLSDRVTTQAKVTLTLRSDSGAVCSSSTCSGTVTASNAGPGTANGTLFVTAAGQTALSAAVSLPPGARRTFPFTATNTAPADTTIPVTYTAVFHDPAVMGDDPGLVRRLAGRGFNVNKPIVSGQPNGKPVLEALDALTPDLGASTIASYRSERIAQAIDMVSNAIRQGIFDAFYNLIKTDNLHVDAVPGVREMTEDTDQLATPQDIRVLQHAANLALAGHQVTWGTTYRPAGATSGFRADILDLTTRQALEQRSIIGSTSQITEGLREAVTRFQSGLGGASLSGFTKDAWIDIDPYATTPTVNMTRSELLDKLRKLNLAQDCAPDGQSAVDQVVITNYPLGPDGVPTPATSVFPCADLSPHTTPDLGKQILNEQIWKANNDPVWYKKYYETNGSRHSVGSKENGFGLPILAKDADGNWISKHSLPSGPSAVLQNTTSLGRNTVPPGQLGRLDNAALNRRVAMNLTAATTAFEDTTPTPATLQRLTAAQTAYGKQLGNRSNNSSIAEQLGEDAARYHVVPKEFPGAQWVQLPSTPNGASRFDQLYQLPDGGYLIVEAKAPNGKLLWRQGAGAEKGTLVQQGTRAYLRTIFQTMLGRAASSPQDARLAIQLSNALRDRTLQYILVKADENTGTYPGATLSQFKIY